MRKPSAKAVALCLAALAAFALPWALNPPRPGSPPPDLPSQAPPDEVQAEVRELLTEVPPLMPVVVQMDPVEHGWYGLTTCRDGVWYIYLRASNPPEFQQEVLVHEWAHCLAGSQAGHGDEWGRAYARAFRAWYDVAE